MPLPDPNDPEFKASRKLPTLVANRAYVLIRGEQTRIAFGEVIAVGELNYHTAIQLSTNDAFDLATTLLELIEQSDAEAVEAQRARQDAVERAVRFRKPRLGDTADDSGTNG